MNSFIKLVSTGLYIGYIPLAPGTFGTLLGILLFYLLYPLPHYIYVITIVTFIFFSAWVAGNAEGVFGQKDEQKIVIDEVAGYLVTMAFHPWGLFNVVVGFILFRFFDVTKPFPINRLEKKIEGGWGVVLDDVLAGIYSNICLIIINMIVF